MDYKVLFEQLLVKYNDLYNKYYELEEDDKSFIQTDDFFVKYYEDLKYKNDNDATDTESSEENVILYNDSINANNNESSEEDVKEKKKNIDASPYNDSKGLYYVINSPIRNLIIKVDEKTKEISASSIVNDDHDGTDNDIHRDLTDEEKTIAQEMGLTVQN